MSTALSNGWLGYKDSGTGEKYKAPSRNADAYLKLLDTARDQITETSIEALAAEDRTEGRGQGGTVIWDRATRCFALREPFEDEDTDDAGAFLSAAFSRTPPFSPR